MTPLELVVFLDDAVVRHALPAGGRVRIGRAADSDICIDHSSVSRRHAVLEVGPPMSIEDLGSANGTAVERPGTRAAAPDTAQVERRPGQVLEVAIGDRVVLGTVTAVVRRVQAASGAEVRDPRAPVVAELPRGPAVEAVYAQARLAAQSAISVLILGETGVGKDVLARAIHAFSPRASGKFVAVSCAALSESLLEAEIFGHERGAFTGAAQARPGIFEAADGGTVFLDEAGEMPPSVQVKLLRVLEERAVTRIGARIQVPIDVRFVAATHRDLEAEVARGAFRQDLFYRIAGLTLTLPPLRERPTEIEALARRFLDEACRRMERAASPSISGAALAALRAHAWPGNVRELRNAMERAAALATGVVVGLEHLPPRLVSAAPAAAATAPSPGPVHGRAPGGLPSTAQSPEGATPGAGLPAVPRLGSLAEIEAARAALERQRILEALEACGGNQTRAAEALGISRRTLVTRLGEYGLPRPRKRG